MDKPWDVHLVTSQDERIQSLEWDVTGERLLLVGGFGVCQIWVMKVSIFNNTSRKVPVAFLKGVLFGDCIVGYV
jgi:hypothetical protein